MNWIRTGRVGFLYRIASLGGVSGMAWSLFGSEDQRWLVAVLSLPGLAMVGLAVELVRLWGGYYGRSRGGGRTGPQMLHRVGFWSVVAGHGAIGAVCLYLAASIWP